MDSDTSNIDDSNLKSESTNNDIIKFLKSFQENMAIEIRVANEKTNEHVDKKMAEIEKQIYDIKQDDKIRDEETTKRFDRMETRLNIMEEEKRREKHRLIKQNKLKQMEQELALQTNKNSEISKEVNNEEGEGARFSVEKEVIEIEVEKNSYKSTFASTLEDESKLENAFEKIKATTEKNGEKAKETLNDKIDKVRLELKVKEVKLEEKKKKRKEEKGSMKKLRRWFGDETDSEVSDSDNDSDSWSTVERTAKNRQKRKEQQKRKKKIEMQTLQKAKHLLGITPISREEIERQRDNTENFEEAKLAAVNEYLRSYLCFSEKEIEEMKISETLISAKGDDTVYIAVDDLESIKEIGMRIAESGIEDLSTRNYIPPQLFERYMEISRRCTEARRKNPALKTQIRYGDMDIEVYTKTKGSKESYKFVTLEEVMGNTPPPPFDHNRKWQAKRERPPRRRVDYSTSKIPASRQRLLKHPLSRQGSMENNPKIPRNNAESRSGSEQEDEDMSSTL